MVQWGAKGKADRGLSYSDILAAYYGGLRPTTLEAPGIIRVLIAEGLESVTVAPSGLAEVSGAKSVPSAPWVVTGGRRLSLSKGGAPSPLLEIEAGEVKQGADRVRTSVEISKNANLRFEFLQGDVVKASTPWRPHEKGRASVRERLPALSAGTYATQIAASDGVDVIATQIGRIRVSGKEASAATPPATLAPTMTSGEPATALPADRTPTPSGALLISAAVVLFVALLALAAGRRRGSHRP